MGKGSGCTNEQVCIPTPRVCRKCVWGKCFNYPCGVDACGIKMQRIDPCCAASKAWDTSAIGVNASAQGIITALNATGKGLHTASVESLSALDLVLSAFPLSFNFIFDEMERFKKLMDSSFRGISDLVSMGTKNIAYYFVVQIMNKIFPGSNVLSLAVMGTFLIILFFLGLFFWIFFIPIRLLFFAVLPLKIVSWGIGVLTIVGLVGMAYYFYQNPVDVPCACHDPPFWGKCATGDPESQKCKTLFNTVDDMKGNLKNTQTELKKIKRNLDRIRKVKFPKIPTKVLGNIEVPPFKPIGNIPNLMPTFPGPRSCTIDFKI